MELTVKNGALTEAPIYENHKRGKNWMAVIEPDPTSPGGISRAFQQRANGEYFYMLGNLEPGDAVEFGADYISSSGKRSSSRWYGVVISLSDNTVAIEKCENTVDLWALRTSVRASLETSAHKRSALVEEKSALLARLKEIDKLLQKM